MSTMMALLFPVSQSLKIDSHKIDERGYFKATSHPVIVKAAQGTRGQGTMVLEVYIQVQ